MSGMRGSSGSIQNSADLPVLVVDDEVYALKGYELQLIGEGIENIICCQSGAEALDILSGQRVSLVLLDLRMAGISGEDLLTRVVARYPEIPVVVVTGIDDAATAVRCMKAGAFDYIVKPIEQTRLITIVTKALEFFELRCENILLKESILGRNLQHPQGNLVAVNLAGLDDNLFADTLFGHTRGAFTGADRARPGLIEKAADGTLFLDEIGDLSPASQVKLLRLVQEREYFTLGSDNVKKSNARLIVATNRDLARLRDKEKFRNDLYYRLLHHRIEVPPLRQRQEDIPLLANYFIKQAASELSKAEPAAPPELFNLLSVYDFPGNIRELKSLIYDAVSCHHKGKLSLESFKMVVGDHPAAGIQRPGTLSIHSLYASLENLPSLKESEDLLIEEALKRGNGNQSLTALMLGISRQTLHRRARREQR
jgi:DNA-binding NtrC family response regulator